MSNPDKKPVIPDAPAVTSTAGNLLSSVAPPTELPNFLTSPLPVASQPTQIPPQSMMLPTQPIPQAFLPPSVLPPQATMSQSQPDDKGNREGNIESGNTRQKVAEAHNKDSFSPAIPLSKGMPTLPVRTPDDSQATTQSPVSLTESTLDMDTLALGDVMPGSGLLTWVKGAVSTGGLLHRVAEKAKSSVDSMITTLDPQMKEYLQSGGDIQIVVASDKDVKISPIREAFQHVFGKATVIGIASQSEVTAVQPVGFPAAYAAAKQRIALVRANHAEVNNNVPVVAVEGLLFEAMADKWFDVALLVLSQPSLGIEVQMLSQSTPVPSAAVALLATNGDTYEHKDTGFANTVGEVMGTNLQVPHHQWQEAATGVSRRDLLLLAAKSLAGSYKKLLAISAAQT